MTYTERFPIQFAPIPHPDSVVRAGKARITLLTERLLRLEYDPEGKFEDRPSQVVWYRDLPVPEFDLSTKDQEIRITTPYLELFYLSTDKGFAPDTLKITLKETQANWRPGQVPRENLLGTARTLDETTGTISLEAGLLSREGWSVIDDTTSLVFNTQGWLEPRRAVDGYQDLYFFGYGSDYPAALEDYAKISGPVPLIPRWMLGNWWSRYWAYSDKELLDLMLEFKQHQIPMAVCVVDMDWHITDTGNEATGWTGYTWNKDLFPDPETFINELHKIGLHTALNLHPAEGVYPHEADYPAFARALNVDEKLSKPIEFDIANPEFTRAYFEILHHPLEEQGVDFWWLDWQQGNRSKTEGLDPLWWLNHLHYFDLGRDGKKRPVIFSRWGGLGNHRYPIGFSGDTEVSWNSLAFQPYFTATAANVNYGWWSHDIGGHMGGIEDRELYTRWVQFGVFSPIFRLHCTKNKFHERRPWGYDPQVAEITGKFMRLRHKLIPYLYSMAYRNHVRQIPLIRGMYHQYPDREEAYHCPDQYLFGSEMLVAPYLSPQDDKTNLSRTVVWLPEGDWFDFFSGDKYEGDQWLPCYGRLEEMPVFAKAGAIVPLAVLDGWSDTGQPGSMEVDLFPLADNEFELYVDDEGGRSARRQISQKFSEDKWEVVFEPWAGDIDILRGASTYILKFRGITEYSNVSVLRNGAPVDAAARIDESTMSVIIGPIELTSSDQLKLVVYPKGHHWEFAGDWQRKLFDKLLCNAKINSWLKQTIDSLYLKILKNTAVLTKFFPALSSSQQRAFLEVFTGAGIQKIENRDGKGERLIFWNNHQSPDSRLVFSILDKRQQPFSIQNEVPSFGVFTIDEETLRFDRGSEAKRIFTSALDWAEWLDENCTSLGMGAEGIIQLEIVGDNTTSIYLELNSTGLRRLSSAENLQVDAYLSASEEDWLALVNGWEASGSLILSGRLRLAGDHGLIRALSGIVPGVLMNDFSPHTWKGQLVYFGGLAETVVSAKGSGFHN